MNSLLRHRKTKYHIDKPATIQTGDGEVVESAVSVAGVLVTCIRRHVVRAHVANDECVSAAGDVDADTWSQACRQSRPTVNVLVSVGSLPVHGRVQVRLAHKLHRMTDLCRPVVMTIGLR